MRYTIINKDWTPIDTVYGSPPSANDLIVINNTYYDVLQIIHKKIEIRRFVFWKRFVSEVFVVVSRK